MMQRNKYIESTYMSLLRQALWGGQSLQCSLSVKEATSVLNLATKHATGALIANELGVISGIDRSIRQQCLQMKYTTFKHQEMMNNLHLDVVSKLSAIGIQSVLLKGMGLALLYPHPELRTCGDVDLYIEPKDFHRACKLLRELPNNVNIGEEQQNDLHYRVEVGGPNKVIEIHGKTAEQHRLIAPSYFELEKRGMQNGKTIQIEHHDIIVPEDKFNSIFVLLHIMHHFESSGIGWRQVCDWVMLLHDIHQEGNVDLRELKLHLKKLQLFEIWQVFGCLVVKYLGLRKEECPFYNPKKDRMADRVYERIMTDGNFGRENVSSWKPIPTSGMMRQLSKLRNLIIETRFYHYYFPITAWKKLIVRVK